MDTPLHSLGELAARCLLDQPYADQRLVLAALPSFSEETVAMHHGLSLESIIEQCVTLCVFLCGL